VEELPETTPMPKVDFTSLDLNESSVKEDDGGPAAAQQLRNPAERCDFDQLGGSGNWDMPTDSPGC